MEATKIDAVCINQLEQAARWRISHRTLERWRWTGEGPKYLKVGGRVVYRVADTVIAAIEDRLGQIHETPQEVESLFHTNSCLRHNCVLHM